MFKQGCQVHLNQIEFLFKNKLGVSELKTCFLLNTTFGSFTAFGNEILRTYI